MSQAGRKARWRILLVCRSPRSILMHRQPSKRSRTRPTCVTRGDMARKQVGVRFEQGVQVLREFSLQFVSFLIEEGIKGRGLDAIVSAFGKHRSTIISGVFGGAGLAGGAWAAVTMWTGSVGLWGGVAMALGFASTPVWVPVAGGVAGLTAAGGALFGVRSLTRSRGKKRKLQIVIGFSKLLLDGEKFAEPDVRVMRNFLLAKDVKEDQIEQLLLTTAATARELSMRLSTEDRGEIARYIFPLVYNGDGLISSADRRRFARICSQLRLEEGEATAISRDYRKRLDTQWSYLRTLVTSLNYFVEAMLFDSQEMELVRQQLEQLMNFDPRKGATVKRQRGLDLLGSPPLSPATLSEDVMGEAAVLGAYALAQTVLHRPAQRRHLGNVFDGLVDRQTELSQELKQKLQGSRRKVDDLYETTRSEIAAAARKLRQPPLAAR